jgi:hypothetical protein
MPPSDVTTSATWSKAGTSDLVDLVMSTGSLKKAATEQAKYAPLKFKKKIILKKIFFKIKF